MNARGGGQPPATLIWRIFQGGKKVFINVASKGKTALSFVGLRTVVYLSYKRKDEQDTDKKEKGESERVLVLPFHWMKVVERNMSTFSNV